MEFRHIGIAVVIAAIWGVNFVVIDVGLRTLPPLLFAGLRFSAAAFPAVLFVRRPAATTASDTLAAALIIGGVALANIRRLDGLGQSTA